MKEIDIPKTTKAMRLAIEKRADELVGCTENSPEEAELRRICDILDELIK